MSEPRSTGPGPAPGEARQPPGVLDELRRRRVLRVSVVYVAVAFALLEALGLGLARLGGPQLAFRVALGAAVLGFPAAVVLAWEYDITPRGIERTPIDAADDPSYQAGPGIAWAWTALLATVLGAVLEAIR